jgi:hypothetical protein
MAKKSTNATDLLYFHLQLALGLAMLNENGTLASFSVEKFSDLITDLTEFIISPALIVNMVSN